MKLPRGSTAKTSRIKPHTKFSRVTPPPLPLSKDLKEAIRKLFNDTKGFDNYNKVYLIIKNIYKGNL